MNFSVFSKAVNRKLNSMSTGLLFQVDIDPDKLWDIYLNAFPEGTNPIYKERTEYDCNCCKQFIRNVAGLVAFQGGTRQSVWNLADLDYPFNVVASTLLAAVSKAPIKHLFMTDQNSVSKEVTYQILPESQVKAWNHFHFTFKSAHVLPSPAKRIGEYRATHDVFERGLKEITKESLEEIVSLIDSDSLYRGQEHLAAVKSFSRLKAKYLKLKTKMAKSDFVWQLIDDRAARFRNTVIGTLATDISDGVDLDRAVGSFEAKVAPSNYKRSKALITPAMVKAANTKLVELGLANSINYRMAKTEDVSINNVLYADQSVLGAMQDTDSLMALLQDQTQPAGRGVTSKNKGTDISIEDFIKKVVPTAKSMELYLANELASNLMTLTAPVDSTAAPIFKWANNFGWSYKGNVTDSVKERVKAAGGNIEADLRVSLSWFNEDDLDIHCVGVDGHVYFGNKRNILDVDMNNGNCVRDPVENLAWNKPRLGKRTIRINNYRRRERIDVGFSLQVEYQGEVTNYHYNLPVTKDVNALELDLTAEGLTVTVLDAKITSESISTNVWGLATKDFHKINMMTLSPNYWDEQEAQGNKHYFFILDKCKNDESCRGLYNEYLRADLNEHRKVFEVLADKTKCEVTDGQLSGVGVSCTLDKQVRIRVKGDTNRLYNVNF